MPALTEEEQAAIEIIEGCTPPEDPFEETDSEEKRALLTQAREIADAVSAGTMTVDIVALQDLAAAVQIKHVGAMTTALNAVLQ